MVPQAGPDVARGVGSRGHVLEYVGPDDGVRTKWAVCPQPRHVTRPRDNVTFWCHSCRWPLAFCRHKSIKLVWFFGMARSHSAT